MIALCKVEGPGKVSISDSRFFSLIAKSGIRGRSADRCFNLGLEILLFDRRVVVQEVHPVIARFNLGLEILLFDREG